MTLPEDLREKAGGVRIVTCRYIGDGRRQRIITKRSVRGMERLEHMGPETSRQIEEHQAKVAAGKVKLDPDEMLVQTFPPDLVLGAVVRALDGEKIHGEDLEDWVDDVHPDVARHVALEMIRESDLKPEDEDKQGEGSGGSSGSSSGPKPVPMKSERSRRRTATS